MIKTSHNITRHYGTEGGVYGVALWCSFMVSLYSSLMSALGEVGSQRQVQAALLPPSS